MIRLIKNLLRLPLFKKGDIIREKKLENNNHDLEILAVHANRYEYRYLKYGIIATYEKRYIDKSYRKVYN